MENLNFSNVKSYSIGEGYIVERKSQTVEMGCVCLVCILYVTFFVDICLFLVSTTSAKSLQSAMILFHVAWITSLIGCCAYKPLSLLSGEKLVLYPDKIIHRLHTFSKKMFDVDEDTFFSHSGDQNRASDTAAEPCVILYFRDTECYMFKGLDVSICDSIACVLNEELYRLRHVDNHHLHPDIESIFPGIFVTGKCPMDKVDGIISEDLCSELGEDHE